MSLREDEVRLRHIQIPRQNVIAMRNRLIHAYYDVDLNIVWGTVTQDIPPLIQAIQEIVS
jgi:uncharacterized protein with HEPN domain